MENIFSTRERLKILDAIAFKRDQISVNLLARSLRLSKALVSKYLDLLAKEGIAKREGGKFTINDASPMVKGIKILINLKRIPTATFRKYPFVRAVELFGSCAKGENSEDSDIDLWILIDETNEEQQSALTSEIYHKIKNAKILLLTEAKLKKLKSEDELFFHALSFGSILLYGEPDALHL